MATILVVEDDASNRVTMAALLEDEGFHVETASSCAEARDIAAATRPALVLLDQNLGDGLGSDLAAELRASLSSTRLVLLTGEVAPRALADVDASFTKGAPFPDVVRALRALLGWDAQQR